MGGGIQKMLVGIVNYNSWVHIEELLSNIVKNNINIENIDFCIVDNQSPNDDFEEMKHYCDLNNIYCFLAEKNGWFAYGNNQIVNYMKGLGKEYEYFFLINPDMLIEDPNFFVTMYEKAREYDADIIGPMICEYKNKEKIHFAWGFLLRPILFPTKRWRWTIDIREYQDIECDYINGSAMMVKWKIWEKYWGMDECYFLYFEETDFCRKAKIDNKKIICTTVVRIYDKISGSVGRMSPLYKRQMVKNYKKFADKYIFWWRKFIWWLFYVFVRRVLFVVL